jgi:hypothetical protein
MRGARRLLAQSGARRCMLSRDDAPAPMAMRAGALSSAISGTAFYVARERPAAPRPPTPDIAHDRRATLVSRRHAAAVRGARGLLQHGWGRQALRSLDMHIEVDEPNALRYTAPA